MGEKSSTERNSAQNILSFTSTPLSQDEMVMMPSGAAAARGAQKAAMAGVIYDKVSYEP